MCDLESLIIIVEKLRAELNEANQRLDDALNESMKNHPPAEASGGNR